MSNFSTLNVCACPRLGAARMVVKRTASAISNRLVMEDLRLWLRTPAIVAAFGPDWLTINGAPKQVQTLSPLKRSQASRKSVSPLVGIGHFWLAWKHKEHFPMNVSLTPELEEFVSTKVESGRYNSASEVVRAALRLPEAHESARASRLRSEE